MNRVCIFTGVPIDDAATLYRAGLVAKKLKEKGYDVLFTSVSASFKKKEIKNINGLEVTFIGQTHYKASKKFSTRTRLGIIKTLFENIKTCIRFYKLLKQYKPDKVLIVTAMPVSLMAGVVSKLLGFKTIIDIEDLAEGQMQSSGYSELLIILYRIIEKVFLAFFDKIIVPGEFLKKRYPKSIILPNMVDVNFWRNSIKKNNKNERRIVFVGQMGPYHGQKEVLLAMIPVLEKNKNLKLFFIGGGEEISNIKYQISNIKCKRQVILTGQVSQIKVREILSNADIGILPLWDTPVNRARHPLKLLEYMAAGLVVVTNKVGEAERIIKNNVNGILCPPGDMTCIASETVKIFNRPVIAKEIRSNAIISARKFSIEKILSKWEQILNS